MSNETKKKFIKFKKSGNPPIESNKPKEATSSIESPTITIDNSNYEEIKSSTLF